jgi:hypothetical protein
LIESEYPNEVTLAAKLCKRAKKERQV